MAVGVVAVHNVHKVTAAGLERFCSRLENFAVFRVVFKVADRAVGHVQNRVEFALELHLADIRAEKPRVQPFAFRLFPGVADIVWRDIHAGDGKTAPRQRQRMAAEAAGKIENLRSALQLQLFQQEIHLPLRVLHPGLVLNIQRPDLSIPVARHCFHVFSSVFVYSTVTVFCTL